MNETFYDYQQLPKLIEDKINQVISILQQKGIQYQQHLIQQLCKDNSKQYQFLLPKSRFHSFYLNRINQELISQRSRKAPANKNGKQNTKIIIEGNIQQVSVGAMSQFVKELLQTQSKPAYQPFQNDSLYQQFSIDFSCPSIVCKVDTIVQKIKLITQTSQKIQKNNTQSNSITWKPNLKIDKFRKQLGTQNDGSLGSWGGKKYEGLGSRNEFTDFRRQKSQQYYQSSSKDASQIR